MAKKRPAESKINTEGWMMSYADMATILLAMFIVLSTFGKDQTGATLQRGLESWRESRQFFGLAGLFPGSMQVTQLESPGPKYLRPGDESDTEKPVPSPVVVDVEKEALQEFLEKLSQRFQVKMLPRATGQATLDFFEPLARSKPLLSQKHLEAMGLIMPLLKRPEYRVSVIVWATMPSETAWTRAAQQARAVADELAAGAHLDEAATLRLTALGQPWRYAQYQRPIFSLQITRSGG